MSRFGGIHIDELNGQQINRVENILTLTPNLHALFGPLDVWLEAVEVSSLVMETLKCDVNVDYRDGNTHIASVKVMTTYPEFHKGK